jgi:hypothetical protein
VSGFVDPYTTPGSKKPERDLPMFYDMTTKSFASINIIWHHVTVIRMRREAQNGHRGFTVLSMRIKYD